MGLNSVTKTSPNWLQLLGLPQAVWKAPGVVGKFVEVVYPVTYASPKLSTAMPLPHSFPLPPR